MMKFKSIGVVIALTQIGFGISMYSPATYAENNVEAVQEEVEKGPNNGRMLRDGDFAIELAIFETGVPPEFRVFATKGGNAINPKDVELNVKLTRLGDGIDDINFFVENNYLRGNMEIYEPHSFLVTLTAKYQGKTYQWSYDNYEGRTQIVDSLAQSMGIETEVVANQEMEERLKVYGALTLPASATRNISARFPGEVKALYTELGKQVKKGQVLMTIEANESLQRYDVVAPIGGVVTAQNVAVGEQSSDRSLLTITNTSELVAELNVYPMDQSKIKLGTDVYIHLPGYEGVVKASLSDSLYQLTAEQAKVYRAVIDNSDNQFSQGQFVIGQILVDTYTVDMAVKAEGLQSFRDFTVVYGKFGDQYEVRMLELGRKSGDWVEVLGGIALGTEYVTTNSYLIKADIEKSGASHDH
ncbi:efflux RND transporter periplasmic adaptor subunit [Pseudoalteromonas sp.]|uniref:efflux RND transporter periplasmic adaptor subunit n=1 Tax=Pseudoalteromonas sp. TaxID=53249 RepID=UPI0034341096|tara:strand:- start:278 stop:1519 length:1242 start_codon:yes stop_codon:yes gene_type:complete